MSEIEQDVLVEDDAENDISVSPIIYNITSYGADYVVTDLVNRLKSGDIAIPNFQRAFVWKEEDASSFIESLLLGLPVPGIFLATEQKTNRLMVIDGQQRLKSLQFFYEGFFDPKPEDKKKKVFKLIGVQPQFNDRLYDTISEKDRRRLNDSIIHATVIKQESPKDGDTSIYHIFRRLNASGMILKPQEIRRAAFHGKLLERISNLNLYTPWRIIFGGINRRLKDEELILRFLALYFEDGKYSKPMEEFLNNFALAYVNPPKEFLDKCEAIFKSSIDTVQRMTLEKPFRIIRGINAAFFDSIMVGIARRLDNGKIEDIANLKTKYDDLLQDKDFRKAITDGTSDETAVETRIEKSEEAFAGVK